MYGVVTGPGTSDAPHLEELRTPHPQHERVEKEIEFNPMNNPMDSVHAAKSIAKQERNSDSLGQGAHSFGKSFRQKML